MGVAGPAGAGGLSPGRRTSSVTTEAGSVDGIPRFARRIRTRPPTCNDPAVPAVAAARPRTVMSASRSALMTSDANGRASRIVTLRSTGRPGASTPTLPVTDSVPGPARPVRLLICKA